MESHKHQRAESDINEDVDQYEMELKRAKLNEGRGRPYNNTRERSTTRERRDRKRSKSPRSERLQNSPQDKKKEIEVKLNTQHSINHSLR